MRIIKAGDRVRISEGGTTGRVVAIINGALYRVRYDQADLLGNVSGDYLAHVLQPLPAKR
jgi:hypothetical protein